MKSARGFTLIELVVVIVILGILSVTAAPKFLNLQDDAKNATLEGMKGAISGAIGITYGKIAIRGLENEHQINSMMYPDLISSCGTDPGDLITFCSFNFGYPSSDWGTLPNLVNGISATPGEEDWFIGERQVTPEAEGIIFSMKITPSSNVNSDGSLKSDSCYVRYSNWFSRVDLTVPVPPPTIEVVECN